MFKSLVSFSSQCLHSPWAGRQAEPSQDIYKSEINALNGELHCWYLEAHAQCAYLRLIYELRWVLWYLIELALWNSRLHKRQRIINKQHNWIPEVGKAVEMYLQLIRVHIRCTVAPCCFGPSDELLMPLLETLLQVVWSHFPKWRFTFFWHCL